MLWVVGSFPKVTTTQWP